VSTLALFQRVVLAACGAGLVAGALLTGMQRLQVVPLLLEAERYEEAAAKGGPLLPAPVAHAKVPTHTARRAPVEGGAAAPPVPKAAAQAFVQDQTQDLEWSPAAGGERTLYTLIANLTIALGYALALGAAITLRGGTPSGWRAGLLWGTAGYLVFFLAPALGLPPEVPGTASAALGARQAWWLFTVISTAGGLWAICFAGPWPGKVLGLALLAVPHLLGAPAPMVATEAAPAGLIQAFRIATAWTNAVFWWVMGGLLGWFLRRLATAAEAKAGE
jgi:cobalt transporter subunit CbtA